MKHSLHQLNQLVIITQRFTSLKKVALESPATALKVFFAGNKVATSDLKVLFKILRTDDASDFDELNYEFFNTTGVPDGTVAHLYKEMTFKNIFIPLV